MRFESANICGSSFIPWKEAYTADPASFAPPDQWTTAEKERALSAVDLGQDANFLVGLTKVAPGAFTLGHYDQLSNEASKFDGTTQHLIGSVVTHRLGLDQILQ